MSTSLSDMIISEETRLMLEELAELDQMPLQDVLAQAVKDYWGRRIIDASNEAYRGLQADPRAWQELHEERAAWEATLADGLDEA
jgi:hypothetical protein